MDPDIDHLPFWILCHFHREQTYEKRTNFCLWNCCYKTSLEHVWWVRWRTTKRSTTKELCKIYPDDVSDAFDCNKNALPGVIFQTDAIKQASQAGRICQRND